MRRTLEKEMLKTVLLVEDDKSFRESVRKLLEKEGIRVLETSSGEEGIEILRSDRMIDLVLLDFCLSGITGMEFLEKTGDIAPPVIMLTAFTELENCIHASNRGAAGFVPKPVKRQELMGLIHQVFDAQKCA